VAIWPANYAAVSSTQAGVISVMATDQADARATFSNYGAAKVTIGAPGVNIMSTIPGRAILQQETGAAKSNSTNFGCEDSVATAFDGTIFDRGSTDCVGSLNRWGWFKDSTGFFSIWGDLYASSLTYENSINGSIFTQNLDTTGRQHVALHYTAAWDTQCASDGVYVNIYHAAVYQGTAIAGAFNINESQTDLCASIFTHTGRSFGIFGVQTYTYDITALADSQLIVGFQFVTNASTNTSAITGGFRVWDVKIDAQATDYSTSYEFLNGTSMASPLVAGIGALVKSQNPAYTGADIKNAIVNGGDTVPAFSTLVSSGKRANANNAVRYIAPPAGVTLTAN
jgi:subtilisin family serine protease